MEGGPGGVGEGSPAESFSQCGRCWCYDVVVGRPVVDALHTETVCYTCPPPHNTHRWFATHAPPPPHTHTHTHRWFATHAPHPPAQQNVTDGTLCMHYTCTTHILRCTTPAPPHTHTCAVEYGSASPSGLNVADRRQSFPPSPPACSSPTSLSRGLTRERACLKGGGGG